MKTHIRTLLDLCLASVFLVAPSLRAQAPTTPGIIQEFQLASPDGRTRSEICARSDQDILRKVLAGVPAPTQGNRHQLQQWFEATVCVDQFEKVLTAVAMEQADEESIQALQVLKQKGALRQVLGAFEFYRTAPSGRPGQRTFRNGPMR